MTLTHTLTKPIWFEVEGRHANKVTELPGGDFVDLLKAIKAEKPADITCDADAIILQAKREGEEEYTTLDADFFEYKCGNSFSTLIESFGVERKNPIKVSLPENERPSKRPRIDRTAAICRELMKKFETIPTQADQLEPLLNAELLCKLPASRHEEEKYPELFGLIYTNEDDCSSDLARLISNALSDVFSDAVSDIKSEDEMHHVVDYLIRDTLYLFKHYALPGTLKLRISRNTADRGSTTTTVGSCRPDFLVHCKDVLVLKGEEKGHEEWFKDALDDLTSKFDTLDPLFFGDQLFLICYAAAGCAISFYAIDGAPEAASMPSRLIGLSPQFDLRRVTDRIAVISTTINIVRILVTVEPQLPADVIPLCVPLKKGSSSTTITYEYNSVIKEVPLKDLPYVDSNVNKRVEFLSAMYQHAKGSPSLVQLCKPPKIKRNSAYKLVMSTRGIRRLPQNETELREMAESLLLGLNTLHAGNYVHRDLRSPNVVFVPQNPPGYKYVLIDFEHGGKAGEKMSQRLSGWDHGTLDRTGKYSSRSDMYEFGKLLERVRNRFNIQISGEFKDFVRTLKEKKTNADQARQHVWINGSP